MRALFAEGSFSFGSILKTAFSTASTASFRSRDNDPAPALPRKEKIIL